MTQLREHKDTLLIWKIYEIENDYNDLTITEGEHMSYMFENVDRTVDKGKNVYLLITWYTNKLIKYAVEHKLH